jgi:hypothetical protein
LDKSPFSALLPSLFFNWPIGWVAKPSMLGQPELWLLPRTPVIVSDFEGCQLFWLIDIVSSIYINYLSELKLVHY